MEKYYLSNGKEVKVGDLINKKINYDSPIFGKVHLNSTIEISEENIPLLLKNGIIYTKTVEELEKQNFVKDDPNEFLNSPVSMDLNFYIEKIARRLNWKVEKIYNYLNSIDSIYPVAVFNIILREISIELDKQYEDHISNSKNIYVISSTNGKITAVNKAHIKNYSNFAAFRTIEDAKIACRITRDIIKDLFKSE